MSEVEREMMKEMILKYREMNGAACYANDIVNELMEIVPADLYEELEK